MQVSCDLCRLDERKRRKDFILERNLLYPNPFEKDLSQEEKVQCRRLDVFMRFHSKEEHEELLRSVVSEYRMVKRLKDLKVRTFTATLKLCVFVVLDVAHCVGLCGAGSSNRRMSLHG